MADQQSTVDGAGLRDALTSIHEELTSLAHASVGGLDPELIQTATDAISKLRLSVALSHDDQELADRLAQVRGGLIEMLDATPTKSPKLRAVRRAAAFVSGAICELRPSLL